MRIIKTLRRSAVLSAAFVLALLTVGCQLPAFTFYEPNDPSETMTEFMDALSRNDVIAINHLIYNCTWSYDTETPLTTADAKLADELTKSRSFTVTDKGIYNSDTNNLTLTIRLTVLNMARFETKLTEAVADDVKAQMYEGIKITDPSDTDQIIQKHKLELLQNPQAFYSTGVYSVNMVLSKGQWRIDMTDELYQALLGLD